MWAALAAPEIQLLAFGLIAIVASLIAETYIISPLRSASVTVSGLPFVGGPLSWALSTLATAVAIAVGLTSWIVDTGKQQAADAFNWLATNSVLAQFGWQLNAATWLANNLGAVAWITTHWDELWWIVTRQIQPLATQTAIDLDLFKQWVTGPMLAQVTALAAALNDLTRWIATVQVPLVNALSNDLAGLHRWLDSVVLPDIAASLRTLADRLARTEADVQTRARQADVDALRQELTRTQGLVTILTALMPLAIAGVESIGNLRCLMDVPCTDIQTMQDSDLEARVSNLELGEL